MASDNIDANFLDTDEIEAVSASMHEWSFEQAVIVAQPIDKDERTLLNWYSPNGQRLPALIKKLATDYDMSYRLALQTAHIHGMAILSERHSETIKVLSDLQSQLSENMESNVFDETGKYKNTFLPSHYKLAVVTDHATADMIGDLSVTIRTPRIYLSSAAILYSLSTAEITPQTKEYLDKQIRGFETGLNTVRNIALGNV